MKILMLGPPGVGKGTIGKLLAAKLHVPHFVMGDVIRTHVHAGTAFGKLAGEKISKGNLIPDERVVSLFFKMTERNRKYAKGVVLDGFPRTPLQIELMHRKGWNFDAVVHLTASKRTLLRRLCARRICPKCKNVYNLITDPPKTDALCDTDGARLLLRDDDTPAIVGHRLEVYGRKTKPVVDYYLGTGKLIRVGTERKPKEILHLVLTKLRKQLVHKDRGIRPTRKLK
ncbi:nucleoside monophosphate kinase [Candidatus Woesearchaeota archaeon]|nr:nucleoside monophosphate kinase [Candidatus Woesearchaeota archaeon]